MMSGMDEPEKYELSSEPKKLNKMSARDILEKHSWLRIDPSNIKIDSKPHAKGGQADVISAILKRTTLGQGTRVAVKKLRYDGDTDSDKFSKSFAYEVDILATLSHQNIVELLGFLEDLETGYACMVFTWEENGNVQEFLAVGGCQILERISLIKDVTGGVEYLHTRQPPICHGDLKSLNILVNSCYRAVITDFGSARALRGKPERKVTAKPERKVAEHKASSQINVSVNGNQLTLTGPSWSLRWASPEVVLGNDPDLPSDVWAVGWVVWEIITDKVPFHELFNEFAVTMAVIERNYPSDVGNDAQMSQIVGLCGLVRDCLAYDPASRPSANKCCTSVKWMPSVVPSNAAQSGLKSRPAALLLNMGYVHYSQSDHDAAAALFKEALESAYTAYDTLSAAEAQTWLGEVYLAQHKYYEAESSFSRALDTYTDLGIDAGRLRALDGLGGVYHARSLIDKANESFSEAEKLCVQIGDDVGRANVLNGIGAVRLTQCRYLEAKQCYAQALAIYDAADNDLGRANSLSGLGRVYHAQCQYEAAGKSFTEAEGICNRVGSDAGLANVLNGIAAVHLATCKYSEAEECYTWALNIYDRAGDYLGRATSLTGLASVYHVRCQYEKAEASLVEAEHICEGVGNDAGRANALTRLATVHLVEGRLHEASQCYTQVSEICKRLGDELGLANALIGLGSLAYVHSHYQEAKQHFSEAHGICARIKNPVARTNALYRIGVTDHLQYKAHGVLGPSSSFTRAARAYDHIGDDLGRANSLSVLGDVYFAQGKHSDAEAAFQSALAIHERIGNEQGRGNALNNIGLFYDAVKRYDDAAQVFLEERLLWNRVGFKRGEAHALIALGCVKHARGDGLEAVSDYLEARDILAELGGPESPTVEMKDSVSLNDESLVFKMRSFLTTERFAKKNSYLRSIYPPF